MILGVDYHPSLQRIATRPWVLMEICGGQTHTIMRYGIDKLLPREVELVHGPGCGKKPICMLRTSLPRRC
jgi:hydrogenase expression/formation protein HypD